MSQEVQNNDRGEKKYRQIFSTDNQVTVSFFKSCSRLSHTCMTTDTCKKKRRKKVEVNNCTKKQHLESSEKHMKKCRSSIRCQPESSNGSIYQTVNLFNEPNHLLSGLVIKTQYHGISGTAFSIKTSNNGRKII